MSYSPWGQCDVVFVDMTYFYAHLLQREESGEKKGEDRIPSPHTQTLHAIMFPLPESRLEWQFFVPV